MENIKVFTTSFIQQLGQRLQNEGAVNKYITGKSPNFCTSDVKDTILKVDVWPKLDSNLSKFENARILYESLQNMNRTMASDQRLWAWLAHVPFMDYMAKRWLVVGIPKEKQARYIIQHWFVETQTGRNYLRHGIASLWWGVHMTYDENREDPFELTSEFFGFYRYTNILDGSLGKSDIFMRALLGFILDNPQYFADSKEKKVNALIRRLNFIGAYRILPALDEQDLRNIFKESIR